MGMFETVKTHGEKIDDHGRRIVTLEERADAQEEAKQLHEERLKKLEDNALKLENTIMVENRDTRTTMKEQTEKLFDIVDKAMGYQSNEAVHNHEQKMAKMNMWANVILKIGGALAALLSSGGILYYVLVYFITKGAE